MFIGIPLWIQFVQSLENNYNGWLDEFIVIDGKFRNKLTTMLAISIILIIYNYS